MKVYVTLVLSTTPEQAAKAEHGARVHIETLIYDVFGNKTSNKFQISQAVVDMQDLGDGNTARLIRRALALDGDLGKI